MNDTLNLDVFRVQAEFSVPVIGGIVTDDMHTAVGIGRDPSVHDSISTKVSGVFLIKKIGSAPIRREAFELDNIALLGSLPRIRPRSVADIKRRRHRVGDSPIHKIRLVLEPPQTEKSPKKEQENHTPPNIFFTPYHMATV